ncbi:MAG: FAD-dependent oxidoreductase, partial [Ignavibacteriaceae bacterium]|nr:FAD-dependent oxidoreductase [Ignavibacteriaceae bacterium]
MSNPPSIIVVGGNAAGPAAAAKAKRVNPTANVTLIEATDYISTGSCELPYVLSGVIDSYQKIVFYNSETFQSEKGVNVLTKHLVESINRKEKTISVRNLVTNQLFFLPYTKLILATGSVSNKIEKINYHCENVFTFKTVYDLITIQNYIQEKKSKVVSIVGSGFIGLELSEAFRNLGLHVILIEKENLIFPSAEIEISSITKQILVDNNIDIYTGIKSPNFFYEENKIRKIKIDSRLIETDILITATGFVPNVSLALQSKLDIGTTGAIKVNSKLQTSDSNIFAVGDAVETINPINNQPINIQLASAAQKMGHIAGENAAGGNVYFKNYIKNISLKVFDNYSASVGLTLKELQNERILFKTVQASTPNLVKVMPGSSSVFGMIHFEKHSKRILGSSFFGGKEVSGYADLVVSFILLKTPINELVNITYNYTPALSSLINLLSI